MLQPRPRISYHRTEAELENATRTILVTGVDLAAAVAPPQQSESALGSIGLRRPAKDDKATT